MIYSDYEESYNGQPVIDVLDSVSEDVKDEHPDFEIYRRLRQDGREALRDEAFAGTASTANGVGDPAGNRENPSWVLDKWKFLPMVNQTFHDYPNMKWYLFMEGPSASAPPLLPFLCTNICLADTYISWPTLLTYLSKMDSTQSIYAGQSMQIGLGRFIYGGGGIIVSQPALEAVVSFYSQHKSAFEYKTDQHWAGDAILGIAFEAAGVVYKDIWPFVQSDYPGWLTYLPFEGGEMEEGIKKAWCNPVATFHHVSPGAVRDLWEVEMEWLAQKAGDAFLTQKDVFNIYILPQMARSPRQDWNSDCDQTQSGANSEDACRDACEQDSACLQYSFEESNSRCRTRTTPRLGVQKGGHRSGWLTDRIEAFRDRMPVCDHEVKWPT